MNAHYLVLTLLAFFICTAANTYAQDASENPAIEKMAELEWMIGNWKQDGTWLPTGNKIEALMNCDWLFPQTTIQCEFFFESAPDELVQILIFSYDSDLQNYVTVGYAQGMGPFEGSFVKNGDTWSSQGEFVSRMFKSWDQMIYKPNGDKIDIVQFRSMNGGEVEKVQEAVVTKVD